MGLGGLIFTIGIIAVCLYFIVPKMYNFTKTVIYRYNNFELVERQLYAKLGREYKK